MKWSRAVYAIIVVVILLILYGFFVYRSTSPNTVDLTTVAQLAVEGKVDSIRVDQNDLTVTQKDGTELASNKELSIGLVENLKILGVTDEQIRDIKIVVAPRSAWDGWFAVLGTLLPLILIGGFFFFILRQAQGAGNQALSFGKSRARMFSGDKPTVTFDDVAGADEAKRELAEIVVFLREPEKFISLGARIPKGVLMVGPPG